jgi:signal peptidase I
VSPPAEAGPERTERSNRAGGVLLVGTTLLLALLLRTFVLETFFIPSGSMETTLRKPDRVLVNKFVYRTRAIRRGEIVVFRAPDSWRRPGEKDFIKRVVGLSGDRVACCDLSGRVTVNGVALDEPYIDPDAPPSYNAFDVTVPTGRVFVMGDHRAISADSRRHLDDHRGTIAESSVVGRAFMVVWPMADWRNLPVPPTYATARPRPASG